MLPDKFDVKISEDSKSTQKLLDVISNGVGAVAGSWITRKNAKARAIEIREIAQANHDAELISDGTHRLDEKGKVVPIKDITEINFVGEVTARINYQETKRQNNLKNISQKTLDFLPEAVSEDPVDDDWIARFFTAAQDVSNEDMQKLWAKILSGEIKEPGSYSLRTLDTLKSLTLREATSLKELCNYVFGADLIVKPALLKTSVTLDYSQLLALEEIGLLQGVTGELGFKYGNAEPQDTYIQKYQNYVIKFVSPNAGSVEFISIRLTRSGSELYRLINKEDLVYDASYIKEVSQNAALYGFKTYKAPITYINEKQYQYNIENFEEIT